ncbi:MULTISPECIES: hypothetical protein [Bacillus]|uniref:hypothetical protein n=1 Tax=Bacillus TaxID=1386 RepID=UPI0003D62028|nr:MULTISPECIES: hypothetical protein [Bacillus]AHC44257.1 hypothetical protein U722_19740 [Bacillus amyloliquefaciens LFB112]AKD31955.1 hypothetical protein AW02_038070 [Bacillus velezensis NJN-6]MBB4874977.1 hypothetical protein [Bacillus velezensis]MBE1281548.1 hypothetical protein [Bacillus sp. Bvel1]MBW8602206.1 hypothetical protein [Bacillus amyloliquefaciens]
MKNKEDFYVDIKKRALNIYEQYQFLTKKIFKNESSISKYRLNFYIKEDAKLGGKAWCEKYTDNILINKGVIDNFFDYFYSFTKMQSETFLKKLNFNDEDETEVSYEFFKFNDNGKYTIFDSKIIDIKLAGLLTIFVSRFIITHELGHLLNGHCEFINSKDEKSIQYIPMFEKDNSQTPKTISPLDFRTLEMDADAFAATDNFRNLILLYERFEEMVDGDLNIKPIELFYWWSFAIRSNFLITQRILNDEEYKADKTHLPSVARWILILGSILNPIESDTYKINYRVGDNKAKLLQSLAAGFVYAEKCYNEVFYTNYNCIEETSNSADYEYYATATQKNWGNLQSELNAFSRLPLYKSGS